MVRLPRIAVSGVLMSGFLPPQGGHYASSITLSTQSGIPGPARVSPRAGPGRTGPTAP